METKTLATENKNPDNEGAQEELSHDLLNKMNAYWRAANYLSVGQIYLLKTKK